MADHLEIRNLSVPWVNLQLKLENPYFEDKLFGPITKHINREKLEYGAG